MTTDIILGQKFILNQYVRSIGNKGKVIEFGNDYNDKRMLQYFLRTGELSRMADDYPLSAGEVVSDDASQTVEPSAKKTKTKQTELSDSRMADD
jgi:hypothetical protein